VPARARKAPLFLPAAVLGAALAALGAAPAAAQPLEESWYLLWIEGRAAGTLHERVWRREDGVLRTEQQQHLELRRFGEAFTMVQRKSWLEGETLLSLDSVTDMNGQVEVLSARVQEGGLLLRERRAGSWSQRLLPASGALLGPRGAGELLRAALSRSPGPEARELRFRQFSPELGGVTEVRVRLLGAGELEDSRGDRHRGWRVDQELSAVPGVLTVEVYDGQGGLKYSAARAGIAVEAVRCSAAEAAAMSPERFEVASLSIPVRWPAGAPPLASLRRVRLRFTGPALPELARSVRGQADGPGLTVTLEAPPPPPAWPPAPAAVGEWSGGGFYLDLDDPRLGQLAAECSPPAFSCLERLVDRILRTKSLRYGFAGVSEVLDSREGDCTEHALLLTALLRSCGLEARIAYGFLLTEAGFVGHSWTEARADGSWFALDPSFPGGAPYRFRLRLGSIDPASPVLGQVGVSLLSVAAGVEAEVLEVRDAL